MIPKRGLFNKSGGDPDCFPLGMKNERKNVMDNQITVSKVKSEFSNVYDEIFEAGKKFTVERFEKLRKVCGNDIDLLAENFLNDVTLNETVSARIEKLSAENARVKRLIDENVAQTMTDKQLKEKFAESQELQLQFSCVDAYIAGVRHPEK